MKAVETRRVGTGGVIAALLLLAGAASTGGYLAGHARVEAQNRKPQVDVAIPEPPAPARSKPADPVVEATPAPIRPETPADPPKEVTENPPRVFYGRPRTAVAENFLKLGWDEFYRKAAERHTHPAEMEDLIFRRLGLELNLDDLTRAALRKVFDRERVEATRAIVDHFGGAATFRMKLDAWRFDWNRITAVWRPVRDAIRRTFDGEYLSYLSVDQLALFNEHLRNDPLGLEASYGPEGSYYLVTGVGRK